MEIFFSGFIAAYRERYSFNNALMRLVGNWRKAGDENFQRDTILMDLSKAFDCIRFDLLIAKPYAHDLSQETTTFFKLYLKRRRQSVRIDDIISLYKL